MEDPQSASFVTPNIISRLFITFNFKSFQSFFISACGKKI